MPYKKFFSHYYFLSQHIKHRKVPNDFWDFTSILPFLIALVFDYLILLLPLPVFPELLIGQQFVEQMYY